jgi:hypothetical protein
VAELLTDPERDAALEEGRRFAEAYPEAELGSPQWALRAASYIAAEDRADLTRSERWAFWLWFVEGFYQVRDGAGGG